MLIHQYLLNLKEFNINIDEIFRVAIISNNLDIVKYLVENGANINASEIWFTTHPLRWASYKGHLDVVKYLIEKGANIHAKNEFSLIHAYTNNHFDVIKYLIDHGANIDAINTACHLYFMNKAPIDTKEYLKKLNQQS